MKVKTKRRLSGYLFILPSTAVISIFGLWPIVYSFYLSLHRYDFILSPTFIGIEQYTRLLKDSLLGKALFNTAYFTFGVVGIGIFVSLSLAILVNSNIKGAEFFKACYFFPVVIAGVGLMLLWQWMYDYKYGIINYFLRMVGFSAIPWLTSPKWAMPAIIFMSFTFRVGLNMIIFLAGLQSIPPSLYEAARIDGATKWKQIIFITVPLLKPFTLFVLITSMIYAMQMFNQSYVVTKGGPLYSTFTVVYYVYRAAFEHTEAGYGCAITYILFIIILVVAVLQMKIFRSEELY